MSLRDRLVQVGCTLALAALFGTGAYLAVAVPPARWGLGGILLAIPIAMLVERWRLARAVRIFRAAYPGKDLLVVYSASPHWQAYIDAHWLSRWADRAVVLNRSAPDWKTRPEISLWRHLAGHLEHTPVAIVVPPRAAPILVRFFLAFRDYKHGRPDALEEKERELERALDESSRSDV